MEAIDEEKRASSETAADEFEVDDALIISCYPPGTPRRWVKILGDKLRVKEFQIYFKSLDQADRARMIRSPKDIDDIVTKQELLAFYHKGWQLGLPKGVDSIDCYQCLTVKTDLYHEYVRVRGTYKSDKDYDKFYSAISEEIEAEIKWEGACQVAENIRKTRFPDFQVSVAMAACKDCFRSKTLPLWRAERARLNFRLFDAVFNKKTKFWHELHIINEKELDSYPYHAPQIEIDCCEDYHPPTLNIESQFIKFLNFVRKSSEGEEEVDKRILEAFAREFAIRDCDIGATYANFAKQKMWMAKKLGILSVQGMEEGEQERRRIEIVELRERVKKEREKKEREKERAIFYLPSSWKEFIEMETTKKTVDKVESKDPGTIFQDNLRVKEFQLFFKSRNEMDRANNIQCLEDIKKNVSRPEKNEFRKKGWILSARNWKEQLSDYQRLTFFGVRFSYQFTTSTYEGDQNYDRFYSALLDKLEWSMSESEAMKEVEALCKTDFPEIDSYVAQLGLDDWIKRQEYRRKVAERTAVVIRLWDEVIKKNRDFTQVLHEIRHHHMHMCPSYQSNIEFDLDYMDGKGFFHDIFVDFRDYVREHSANGVDIDDKLREEYIDKCVADNYMMVSTYADYAKEKMDLAKQLGMVPKAALQLP